MDCESILRLAHLYAARRELTLATVSTYVGGSGDTLARLERGRDMTTRRAARLGQWFSDHWPDDLEWPADIPRPAPDRKEAA